MNKVLKCAVGLLLLFSNPSNLLAQDTEVPLQEVLQVLEQRYQVVFNYDPALVRGKRAAALPEDISLEAAINTLRTSTDLNFAVLDSTTISITPKQLSYKLCGYLKDKDSQEVLAFASIQTDGNAVISNEEGYFELNDINPEAYVSIRYLGYSSIKRQAKFFKSNCETVYLRANSQTLNQVVLQQFLVQGVDKLSSGQYRVDFDRFSILPGLIEADVLQAVQAFPGIQSVNEKVSNINIRGGTHDQNLILWDDIKMYQSGHFFGLISAFNPQMNQEVILTQGGTDEALTDGVSGTIAMKSSDRINPKFKASAGLNLINADLFVDVPVTNSGSIQIAGRKSLSDLWVTPTFTAYFDRIAQNTEITQQQQNTINTQQEFDFYDTSLRYLQQISDKDRLRANFILVNNKLSFTENTLLETSVESRQSQITQNSIAAGLQYIRDWSEELQTEVQVYNTDYKLEAINANIELSQRFLQENSVSETGAKAKVSWQFSPQYGLSGGYQFIETKVRNLDDVDNPVFRSLSGEVVRIHNVFAGLQHNSPNSKWSGRLGVRYNYIPDFDKHILEPRLQLAYKFTPEFSAEVLGEFKNQVTTQVINFQNDFLGVERRRWQMADNDSIPVLESKQASFGLTFNKNGFLSNVTGYFKEVDGISTQSQGFLNQYEFARETGRYEVYGLDLLLRQNFWYLQVFGSYSYMDNRYEFLDLASRNFPSNFNITHTASLGIAYDHKGLKAALGFNWHSGRPYTAPIPGQEIVDGDINYAFPNQENIDDYLRVDASASYSLRTGSVRLMFAASVWNLLNANNDLNRFFRVEANEIAQVNQSSLGLVPNVSVRVIY